jgi:hypothetical protein
MALIGFSLPIAEASGQMDQQIVFSRWRQSPVLRTWTRGSNPDSTDQLTIRNQLSAITKNWDTLTPSQRASWRAYAVANPITNRLGKSVTSTSLGTYVAFESIRRIAQASSSFLTTAPSGTRPAAPTLSEVSTVLSSFDGTINLYCNTSTTPATNRKIYFRIYLPPTSAWTPRYELTKSINGLVASSFPTLIANSGGDGAEYTVPTNLELEVGKFVMISAQVCDEFGRLSLPAVVGSTITAAP